MFPSRFSSPIDDAVRQLRTSRHGLRSPELDAVADRVEHEKGVGIPAFPDCRHFAACSESCSCRFDVGDAPAEREPRSVARRDGGAAGVGDAEMGSGVDFELDEPIAFHGWSQAESVSIEVDDVGPLFAIDDRVRRQDHRRPLQHVEGGDDHEEEDDAEHEQRCLEMWMRWLVAARHGRSSAAVGTRQTMYQTPTRPSATTEMRNAVLSKTSPTLIEIAIAIIEMAVIFARLGMPAPER